MAPSTKRFEDLLVWQRARRLAVEVFKLCSTSRFSREFALQDQLKRAALSIAANIAEGYDRGSRAEFQQFLLFAKGSSAELRSHLTLVSDLQLGPASRISELIAETDEISRMIGGLRTAVKRKIAERGRNSTGVTRDSRLATRD